MRDQTYLVLLLKENLPLSAVMILWDKGGCRSRPRIFDAFAVEEDAMTEFDRFAGEELRSVLRVLQSFFYVFSKTDH